MIYIHRLKYITLVILWISIPLTCIAQKTEANTKSKHAFTASYGLYTFYDGTPIYHRSDYKNKLKLSRGFGLQYMFMIDERNAWSIAPCFYFYLIQKSLLNVEPGTVNYKNFTSGQINYHRTLLAQGKSKFTGSMGVLFRGGWESLHGGFYGGFGDAFSVVHMMWDVGVPIGLQYTRYLSNHWHVNLNLEHTFFPYVYTSKSKVEYPAYEWDKGTSRNMTKLSIGIGVNFGDMKKK